MIRRWLVLMLALAVSLVLAAPASADDFRPAYLQISQRDACTFDVLWKVPALDESRSMKVRPEFPTGTTDLTQRRRSYANGTAVQRWRVS